MSVKIKKIVSRAIDDSEFAKKLLSDPKSVVSEYGLTEEETEKLRSIDMETINSIGSSLDNRTVKDDSWWVGSVGD